MANTPTSMVNAVTGILHHRPPIANVLFVMAAEDDAARTGRRGAA